MRFGSIIHHMVIDMNETRLKTVAQLRAFLEGTLEVKFQPIHNDVECYGFIAAVLGRFAYRRLVRADKGVLMRYLARVTEYSRAQLKRLVSRHLKGEPLAKRYRAPAVGFARKFTAADVKLLAQTDALHNTVSGPATKCLMQRAWAVYGDMRYARLATISVAHLYNLRHQAGYQATRAHWTKTRGYALPIGQRRAPTPDGRPGFIRIDSVHQGDQDGVKGLYHINAVDCVTQYEIVATCEQLSEAFLLPVLRQILAGFPFAVLGFHADNGSEYINYKVAKLLDKLRIEFTKSRPRHSNDNGLAETKNGAIVRKHLGYEHIPQRFAAQVNSFCQDFLNPYVNFHRPCFFAETITDPKGKIRKRYLQKNMMTPYEKLKSLPKANDFLKPGITFTQLDSVATAISDNEAARRLNEARNKLFQSIHYRSKRAA
ncbi:MAG TPA: integrase [Anaerolineae bacterium]|nr:integrase [Anaerolineae bacterium]